MPNHHNFGNRDNQFLQGYLRLVGIELPLKTIEAWSDCEAIKVADFVFCLLKREEANVDIPMPRKPKFLPDPVERKHFRKEVPLCLIKKN